MNKQFASIEKVLREVIAPLIEADGGVLYLVPQENGLHLHLAGACSGCPGARFTMRDIIEPSLRATHYTQEITISAGWLIPEGSEQIRAYSPIVD